MTGGDFIKKTKRLAKAKGLEFSVDKRHGKGSHCTVFLGSASTTVKDVKKEIGIGLLVEMCAQLNIKKADLK